DFYILNSYYFHIFQSFLFVPSILTAKAYHSKLKSASAPRQIPRFGPHTTYDQEVSHMWEITGTTRLAGLLGSPIAHSISPLMHNFSFQYLGIDCTYLAFDINEQTLKEAVNGLKALGVIGFNLTMPNKNKILEYMDGLSDAARLIGAVNTVEN